MNRSEEVRWNSAECWRARFAALTLLVLFFVVLYYIGLWNWDAISAFFNKILTMEVFYV